VDRDLKHPARGGLALLELLTVLSVILLLVGLVIPMFLSAHERSNRFHCQDNLRQIGQYLLFYGSDSKRRLPTTAAISQTPDNTESEPIPAGPSQDNVAAAMFRLIQRYDASPRLFVCPNTEAVADKTGGAARWGRRSFSDVKRNLSYSMHNLPPSSQGLLADFRKFFGGRGDFVIMADMNPGIRSEDDNVLAVTPTSPPQQMRWGNSNNHGKRGQNVLYADGRVEFADNPFVGVDNDNIYTTRSNTIIDWPGDADDSILLPTDD